MMSLVATDGRRLAVANKPMKQMRTSGRVYSSSPTVNELEKLPKTGENLSISFTDRQVAIELKVSILKKKAKDFEDRYI